MKRIFSVILMIAVLTSVLPVTAASQPSWVEISLPDFDIYLNGIKVENNIRQYPFLVSEGVTYFPMTYYDSGFMGVEAKFVSEKGFMVTADNCSAGYREYVSDEENQKNDWAHTTDFDVYINGRLFEGRALEYRYMTYLPLTEAVAAELGWELSFENGLSITSNNPIALPFELPRPIYKGSGIYRTYDFFMENYSRSVPDNSITLFHGMLYYIGEDLTLYRCPLEDYSAEEVLMHFEEEPPRLYNSGYRVWLENLGYYDDEGFKDRSEQMYHSTIIDNGDFICYGLKFVEHEGNISPFNPVELGEHDSLSLLDTQIYDGRLYYSAYILELEEKSDYKSGSTGRCICGNVDLLTGESEVKNGYDADYNSFADGRYYRINEASNSVISVNREGGDPRVEGQYNVDGMFRGTARRLTFGENGFRYHNYGRLHMYPGNGCIFMHYSLNGYERFEGVWWFHILSGKYLTRSALVRLGDDEPVDYILHDDGRSSAGFEYLFETMKAYNCYTMTKEQRGNRYSILVFGEDGETLFKSLDDAAICGGRTANIDSDGTMIYKCLEDGEYFIVKLPEAEGNMSDTKIWRK